MRVIYNEGFEDEYFKFYSNYITYIGSDSTNMTSYKILSKKQEFIYSGILQKKFSKSTKALPYVMDSQILFSAKLESLPNKKMYNSSLYKTEEETSIKCIYDVDNF